MSALHAEIWTEPEAREERSATRRTLRLHVSASNSLNTSTALIYDLSERGLQLETTVDLRVGEALQVDLPHAGATTAVVIWNSGRIFGCEFTSPISKAAVSASLLVAPTPATEEPPQPRANAARDPDADIWEAEEAVSRTVLVLSLALMTAITVAFLVILATFPDVPS